LVSRGGARGRCTSGTSSPPSYGCAAPSEYYRRTQSLARALPRL
jgi:hypothetical protein